MEENEEQITKQEALFNLRRIFWNVLVVKRRQAKTYKYYSIEDVEDVVHTVLTEKDPDQKYYYITGTQSCSVFHTDIEEPIREIIIPTKDFNEIVAGDVKIMSPEQRGLSQMTFSQKESIRVAFFIRSTDDPDKMIMDAEENHRKAEEKKQKHEAQIKFYERSMERIENMTTKDDPETMVEAIDKSTQYTAEQKKSLKDAIEEKIAKKS